MKKIILILKKSPLSYIFIFYLTLFFLLRGKFLFTPDYTSTDAYHFNASLKFYLWESLKSNTIPFWTDKLQGGMPIFAEGQIGALFLPNLFFLKFFSFVDGYNLLFIFSLFILTAGFYLFLREYRLNKWLSVLISFIFTFNGAISFRWVHLNLIQSFSLTPFLFLCVLKFMKTQKVRYGLLAALIICQMIFAGHYQVVFIAVFSLLIWYLFLHIGSPLKVVVREILIILFFIVSGFIFALPQLIPTYKLSLFSLRNLNSYYQYAIQLPLTWKHLLSFFLPFPLGNPKFASYPLISTDWGIFWENSPYLGPFAFPLFCFFLYSFFHKKLYKKRSFYYLILSGIFLLLALGKDSPIFVIFALFPFNIFRVPSKYLLMVNFFLLVFSALVLQLYISRKQLMRTILIYFLLSINAFIILYSVFTYHIFVNSSFLLNKPALMNYISDKDMVLNFNASDPWVNFYIKNGWSKKENINSYLFMLNSLLPNSNLIFHYRNIGINTGGLKLNGSAFFNYLLISDITETKKNNFTVSPYFLSVAPLFNVTKVLTSVKIDNLTLVKQINDPNETASYYLYSISQALPIVYTVPKEIVSNDTFKMNSSFLLKNLSNDLAYVENFRSIKSNNKNASIKIIENKEDVLKVFGDFKNDTFIVFNRNWYPEWDILIDNKKSTYYRSNIVYIGVYVPKGFHTIKIQYHPIYFKQGLTISFAYFIVLFLFIILKNRLKKRA